MQKFKKTDVKELNDFIVEISEETEKEKEPEKELKYFLDGSFRTYYWGDIEIVNYYS
jgi:hypothetical protein